MAVYFHDIATLHNIYPALPLVLLGQLDLNRVVIAGTPINGDDLDHARSVAKALQAIHETALVPEVTNDVVRSAELRASAIEASQFGAFYAPGNFLQLLQGIHNQLNVIGGQLNGMDGQLNGIDGRLNGIDGRLNGIDGRLNGIDGRLNGIDGRLNSIDGRLNTIDARLDGIEGQFKTLFAIAQNLRVVGRNGRASQALSPLQKTIPGHGAQLAAVAAQTLPEAYQEFALAPVVAHPIGSLPPMFQETVDDYSHLQILELIIFYNDDFGIQHHDSLAARRTKVGQFFMEY